MGRPPTHGAPSFRFFHSEVAQMEALLREHGGHVPPRELLMALANKFSNSQERSGKITVQMKQVWNWFQNRRYALRSKLVKSPGNPNVPPNPRDEVAQARNVPSVLQQTPVPSGHIAARNTSENPPMEFEAKSARDGAWYDVQVFLSHRYLETGNPEVLVRFSGFGSEEDEWINVRKHVRQRSLPCESSECVAVLPGDLILCFQEGKEQALYFDAHVLDAQRRRHDVRGCRCRFLVRYDHDQTEEIVPLRKVCRRPETDYRLQQLHGATESASTSTSVSAESKRPVVDPNMFSTLRVTNPNPSAAVTVPPPTITNVTATTLISAPTPAPISAPTSSVSTSISAPSPALTSASTPISTPSSTPNSAPTLISAPSPSTPVSAPTPSPTLISAPSPSSTPVSAPTRSPTLISDPSPPSTPVPGPTPCSTLTFAPSSSSTPNFAPTPSSTPSAPSPSSIPISAAPFPTPVSAPSPTMISDPSPSSTPISAAAPSPSAVSALSATLISAPSPTLSSASTSSQTSTLISASTLPPVSASAPSLPPVTAPAPTPTPAPATPLAPVSISSPIPVTAPESKRLESDDSGTSAGEASARNNIMNSSAADVVMEAKQEIYTNPETSVGTESRVTSREEMSDNAAVPVPEPEKVGISVASEPTVAVNASTTDGGPTVSTVAEGSNPTDKE